MPFFSSFTTSKTGEQNRSSLGVGTSGKVEEVGKGHVKVNIVQIPCT
jgi:hypothetical protein